MRAERKCSTELSDFYWVDPSLRSGWQLWGGLVFMVCSDYCGVSIMNGMLPVLTCRIFYFFEMEACWISFWELVKYILLNSLNQPNVAL